MNLQVVKFKKVKQFNREKDKYLSLSTLKYNYFRFIKIMNHKVFVSASKDFYPVLFFQSYSI